MARPAVETTLEAMRALEAGKKLLREARDEARKSSNKAEQDKARQYAFCLGALWGVSRSLTGYQSRDTPKGGINYGCSAKA
jgi:hypothetical protein